MRDISEEAKTALAEVRKRKAHQRLNKDGASSNAIVRRRIALIAAERKLDPSETAALVKGRYIPLRPLGRFAEKHSLSVDWLIDGDLSKHPRFVPKAKATNEDWAHMLKPSASLTAAPRRAGELPSNADLCLAQARPAARRQCWAARSPDHGSRSWHGERDVEP
jgi:hypothetical protein